MTNYLPKHCQAINIAAINLSQIPVPRHIWSPQKKCVKSTKIVKNSHRRIQWNTYQGKTW